MSFVVEFEHALGDAVRLKEIDRPGVVTSCLRDSDGPQYRVVWWDSGTRKVEWLHGFEIEAKHG